MLDKVHIHQINEMTEKQENEIKNLSKTSHMTSNTISKKMQLKSFQNKKNHI